MTYSTKEDINLQFGFDFNVPFHLKLHSPKGNVNFLLLGLFSLPEVTKGSNPKGRGHKFNHTKDIDVAVGAHFIPGLYLDLTFFNQKIIALGVVMDSSVGAIVSTGKFAKCPGHVVDVSLYTEHEIRAEFDALTFHKKWPIVGTGKVPIANLTPCSTRPPNFQAIPVLAMNSTRKLENLQPIPADPTATSTSLSPVLITSTMARAAIPTMATPVLLAAPIPIPNLNAMPSRGMPIANSVLLQST